MKAMRKIIRIDEELCTGCGDCVGACQEGAIALVDGKAALVKEIYCDGLGACLGHCPTGALTIVEREADEYDEDATQAHRAAPSPPAHAHHGVGGCPGSALRELKPPLRPAERAAGEEAASALAHWPVQLMLVPPHAPFLRGADLLLCADCVPFALPDFHGRFLAGRALLVGCPKLDDLDYYQQKLTAIFATARPKSVTVLRMEVPCCGGLAHAALEARAAAGSAATVEVHTIGIDGRVQRTERLGRQAS